LFAENGAVRRLDVVTNMTAHSGACRRQSGK
jgi:hypothetical protein